jgi:hypothetical protein
MAFRFSFDESSPQIRWGFRAGVVAVTLCAGVLLSQKVLPNSMPEWHESATASAAAASVPLFSAPTIAIAGTRSRSAR